VPTGVDEDAAVDERRIESRAVFFDVDAVSTRRREDAGVEIAVEIRRRGRPVDLEAVGVEAGRAAATVVAQETPINEEEEGRPAAKRSHGIDYTLRKSSRTRHTKLPDLSSRPRVSAFSGITPCSGRIAGLLGDSSSSRSGGPHIEQKWATLAFSGERLVMEGRARRSSPRFELVLQRNSNRASTAVVARLRPGCPLARSAAWAATLCR